MKLIVRVWLILIGVAIGGPSLADHDCKQVVWRLGKKVEKMEKAGILSQEVTRMCSSGNHPPKYMSCIQSGLIKKTDGAYEVVEESSKVYLKKVR